MQEAEQLIDQIPRRAEKVADRTSRSPWGPVAWTGPLPVPGSAATEVGASGGLRVQSNRAAADRDPLPVPWGAFCRGRER